MILFRLWICGLITLSGTRVLIFRCEARALGFVKFHGLSGLEFWDVLLILAVCEFDVLVFSRSRNFFTPFVVIDVVFLGDGVRFWVGFRYDGVVWGRIWGFFQTLCEQITITDLLPSEGHWYPLSFTLYKCAFSLIFIRTGRKYIMFAEIGPTAMTDGDTLLRPQTG